MKNSETLLLTRNDVAALLRPEECISAVEAAFRLHAEGKASPPGILGMHSEGGGFHIKAGILALGRKYFVAKINSNFPLNLKNHNLPTIQGAIVVCDGENGQLLAVMDSIEITILRTGAATAVAANYLARRNASVAAICGCGNQGRISLKMLMKVRNLRAAYVFDIDQVKAQAFAKDLAIELHIPIAVVEDPAKALRMCHICVTCTPSNQPFIRMEDITPGTFLAAVGADSEEKQELESDVLCSAKVVVDLLEQGATIGELHHALKSGCMTRSGVHAELGEIVCGRKPGRLTDDEIIIFDSTGMALQDVAAASIVYEKAIRDQIGVKMNFASA